MLANVLRDTKGANALCSRFGNNTISYISRDFNVLTDISNNPYHKYIFHKQKDLNKMNIEELKELSFVGLNNSIYFSIWTLVLITI